MRLVEYEKSKPKAYTSLNGLTQFVIFEDEFVRNPDPISNDETPDFSYPPSQPQTSSLNQFHCFECKYPLEDGVHCQRCTCKWCGHGLKEGFCLFCASRDENASIDAPNPKPFNDPPNVFTHPPQPQYETYSCELCGNDSHYGYDCPPRFPLVYEQEPCYNQNFGDNYYPQNSPSFPQQYLCCENCGGPHEMVIQQKQAANIDQSPPQEMSSQEMEDLKQHYLDEMQSISNQIQIKDYRNERIDIRFRRECEIMIDELKGKFNGMSIEINKKKELRELKQAANLRNEELITIPEKESDEFIKSSVDDLVPIPSESEDTFESDDECDLSSCEDFFPINVSEEKSVTFSNPLFDSNDDFTSSDDESLSDEDVPEDNNIESKDSYISNLDEPAFLVTPLSNTNEDECFDPGGDVDEIEFLLHRDPSTPKISVAFILKGFTD
ncbi:hypothetical protein Tco_0340147 [Tanacetum coccineum]